MSTIEDIITYCMTLRQELYKANTFNQQLQKENETLKKNQVKDK